MFFRLSQTIFLKGLTVLALSGMSCHHTGPLESEDTDSVESEDSGSDSEASETDLETSGTDDSAGTDSATCDTTAWTSDTEVIPFVPSACDSLTTEECADSAGECALVVAYKTYWLGDDTSTLWTGCNTPSSFGCIARIDCDPAQESVLDPCGTCWLVPGGCRPNQPGWRHPAIDDPDCPALIRVHPCLQ